MTSRHSFAQFKKRFAIPALLGALLFALALPAPTFADESSLVSPLIQMAMGMAPDGGKTSPSANVPENSKQAFRFTPDSAAKAEPEPIVSSYAFGNPAGCPLENKATSSGEMLANVQAQVGNTFNLAERREYYVWNGSEMVDARNDPFVYEFIFNEFQHPLTYRGDEVATIFLSNGFVVWFRAYNNAFRLTAAPMIDGVMQSQWAEYVSAYWQKDSQPRDEYIYPVIKKLPCHWMIDQGYVSNESLGEMFDFDARIPDYLVAGHEYLASTCREANRVSREKIGYWDASSVCGPLAWTIIRDANAFPYRIGSWYANASAFTAANPRGNGQPWGTFDPETFTLTRVEQPMPGYDFARYGNLFTGDIIYSYTVLFATAETPLFDHIFLVAGIDENSSRLSVSNMVRTHPYADCSIEEVKLYTPGDRETGVINREWNGFGFGKTGTTGFDIFRWNWITHHLNETEREYRVRWGDTLETVAFDWKISPEQIASANRLPADAQLTPGEIIVLPPAMKTKNNN
jgi:hypothetical protein